MVDHCRCDMKGSFACFLAFCCGGSALARAEQRDWSFPSVHDERLHAAASASTFKHVIISLQRLESNAWSSTVARACDCCAKLERCRTNHSPLNSFPGLQQLDLTPRYAPIRRSCTPSLFGERD